MSIDTNFAGPGHVDPYCVLDGLDQMPEGSSDFRLANRALDNLDRYIDALNAVDQHTWDRSFFSEAALHDAGNTGNTPDSTGQLRCGHNGDLYLRAADNNTTGILEWAAKQNPELQDWRFFLRPRYGFMGDPSLKTIFAGGGICRKGAVLSAAHEIGHAVCNKPYSKIEECISTASGIIRMALHTLVLDSFSAQMKSEQEKHREHEERVRVIQRCEAPSLGFLAGLRHYTNVTVHNEVEAWRYAVQLCVGLQKEGYDVFAGFEDDYDVVHYIFDRLATYDMLWLVQCVVCKGLDFAKKAGLPFRDAAYQPSEQSDAPGNGDMQHTLMQPLGQ